MGSWGFGIFENDSAQDSLCRFKTYAEDIAKEFCEDNKEYILEFYDEENDSEIVYNTINSFIQRDRGDILGDVVGFELEELKNEEKWACEDNIITLAKLEWMVLGSVSHKDEVIKIIENYIDSFLSYEHVRDEVNGGWRKATKKDVEEYQEFLDNIINNKSPKRLKSYREAISEAMGCDILKQFLMGK